ncbi:MAG: hypothetical protein SNJ72_03985, partial [Fimbriimonadales bacterium]
GRANPTHHPERFRPATQSNLLRHPEPQAKGLDEMLPCVQHDEVGAPAENPTRHPEQPSSSP